MTIERQSVEAALRGETVRLKTDDGPLVLIRADLFERLRDALDPRDAYALINEVMREDDANDPLLATYQ